MVTRKSTQALESDAGTAIGGYAADNIQLLDVAAGVEEAVEAVDSEELELPFELAAGAVVSAGFDASPPDLASALPLAAAGLAEE
jgi:hypothetical protein